MLKQFTNNPDKPLTERIETVNDQMNIANVDINSKLNANTERIQKKDEKINQIPTTLVVDDKDKDKGMRTLSMSVYNPNLLDFNGGESVSKGPDVWVRKWVDYSSK